MSKAFIYCQLLKSSLYNLVLQLCVTSAPKRRAAPKRLLLKHYSQPETVAVYLKTTQGKENKLHCTAFLHDTIDFVIFISPSEKLLGCQSILFHTPDFGKKCTEMADLLILP